MPSLINVPPSSARYAITAAQYAALAANFARTPGVSKLAVNGNVGSVSYEGIDWSWAYTPEPTADVPFAALLVTIIAKHSLKARIAPNATIFQLLQEDLISKL
jgi:hypothetical protein